MKNKLFVFLTALIFSFPVFAFEKLSAKAELGLGFSDNVYQDDLNKVTDAFTWLGISLKNRLSDGVLTSKAQIYLYKTESNNNNLSYTLRYKSEQTILNAVPTFGIGGYSYFKSDIGSTEESYNNVYGVFFLTNEFYKKNNLTAYFEPGVKLTSYPQLSSRYDFNPFVRLNVDWEVNSDLVFMPYFELGINYSNQSYFTRSNVDFGVTAELKLKDDYILTGDVFLRSTSYPNRKVADIILLPRRQGRATGQAVDVSERTYLAQFSVEIMKEMTDYEYGVLVSRSSLNSRSELEFYDENQLNVFARIFF